MVDKMFRALDVHGDRSERYSPARPLELLGLLGRNRPLIKLAWKEFPAYNIIKEELSNEL